MKHRSFCACAAAAVMCLAGSASAQLRVVTWNISNYTGGRQADLSNALFGSFSGRSMNPDVIVTQEFISAPAVATFLAMLNAAQPGQWAAAPFIDGPDTDSAFFYRTSKAEFLGVTTIAFGSSSTDNQPRNTYRYDIVLPGYDSPAAALAIYSVHMKSQGGTNDAGRRLIEAQRIRDNAEGLPTGGAGTGLPAGYRFMVAGDTNIQSSGEGAYQEFINSQPNNNGRFFDPIATPGTWNNNGAFRFVHTQDPSGAGGVDDRHDQILCGAELIDGQGFSYIGNPFAPYSTTTWNDLNHSYRSWGNDGTSFNLVLTIAGNQMVGPTIAQSLVNVAVGGGHLPVFLDLRVPAKIASPSMLDAGVAMQDEPRSVIFIVSNAGEVARWSAAGIDALDYSFSISGDFTIAPGSFIAPAGAPGNPHAVTMDTATPGPKSGVLTILSDDPDQPARMVMLTGMVEAVTPACPGDADGDGFVGLSDISVVVTFWGQPASGPEQGDLDNDGMVGLSDLSVIIDQWGTICP